MSSSQLEAARAAYTRQKRNTQKFKRWLHETAITCGWEPTGFDVTTRDIEDQIHVIAASTNPAKAIPKEIHKALRHAIIDRRECLNAFAEFSFTSTQSTAGHEHFLEILEKALAILPKRESTDESHPSWHESISQAPSEKEPTLGKSHGGVPPVVVAIPDLSRLRPMSVL